MKRPDLQIKTVTTPSGYSVSIKQLSYGDNKAIYKAVLGDTEAGADVKVSFSQAQDILSENILRSIVEWDVTEEDDSATPITLENIESILTSEDMTFLMGEISNHAGKKK